MNDDGFNKLKEVLTRAVEGMATALTLWMQLREKYGSEDLIYNRREAPNE